MRGLISVAVVALAVALQLAVVDRMALPGAAGPSLVLVTVAALALARGPMTGTLTGFAAGLALDVAPPAGHLVGEDALVFCLIGYACGLVATSPGPDGAPDQERSALFELAVIAIGAACGEAMVGALGVMLSDPRVTWSAVKHVLPWAIGYDVMLSPFVLFAVAAILRLAGAPRPGRASQHAPGPARRAWMASPAAVGAVRQLTGGKSPQLHLGGASLKAPASKAGLGAAPKLRFGGMQARHTTPRTAVFSAAPKLRFGGGPARTTAPRSAALGAVPKLRFGTNVGASLLGGSVFAHSGVSRSRYGAPGAGLAKGRARIRRGALARGSASRRAAMTRHAPAGTHAPKFRRPGIASRLAGVARRPARARRPGRGWASGAGGSGSSAVRKTLNSKGLAGKGLTRKGLAGKGLASKGLARGPGKGWIRTGRPARRVGRLISRRPARLRMRPGRGGGFGSGRRAGIGLARTSPRFRSEYAGWSRWRKRRRKRGFR